MSQVAATGAIPLVTRSVAPAGTDAIPISGNQTSPAQNASSATPSIVQHHPGHASHANGTANYQSSAFVKRDPPVPSPQFPTEVE